VWGAVPLRGAGGAPEDEPAPAPANEFDCADSVVDPGPNLVRRLTVNEYVASVHSALDVDVAEDARSALPPDLRSDGFSNTTSGQVLTLSHVEAYEALAATVAGRVDGAALRARHGECPDFDEACVRAFLRSLARPLYRGPLRAEEEEVLLPLFAVVQSEGDDFAVAAGLALEAMLQSPRFLYRVERERGPGGARPLDDYELASRLSFLVWGAPPDDALYDAAEAGTLSDDAQIEAQVLRMLEAPAAREASIRYFGDWLDLGRLETVARDPERFASWSPALAAAMREETARFFEHIVWEQGRPLSDLFDAQLTFATPELAAHYGLPPSDDPDAPIDLSGVPERGGLLTQGALMTIGGDESSMVSRGKFFLETFLCGSISDPPPGVDTTPPEIEPGRSQRSYSEQRVASPVCGGCHQQMEPIAWGVERFDATGAHHLEDEYGNALREDGSVLEPGRVDPIEYATVAELMSALAGSERVRDCLSLSATQYAIGRPILRGDGCSLAAMRDRFAASEGTYADLIVAIALSPGFRSVRTEEAP